MINRKIRKAKLFLVSKGILPSMLLGLALSLFILFVFPAVGFRFFYKNEGALFFPFGLMLHIGFFSLLSSSFHPLPFGWVKLICTVILSLLLALPLTSKILKAVRPVGARYFDWRWVWLLFLATLILNLDVIAIFNRQGWGPPTYFRPPFHSDTFRNVFLINALQRGEMSPFLPGTKLIYQLFWFHPAAVLAAPLARFFPLSQFELVQGITLGFGLVMTWAFLWILSFLRPVWMMRRAGFVFLASFFLFHSDLINFLTSWVTEHQLGIEADWSFSPAFFRNFSFKLLMMVSPQHLFFLFFQGFYWVGVRFFRKDPWRRALFQSPSIVGSFLASPALAGFFFPWLMIAEIYKRPKEVWVSLIKWGASAFLGLGLYWICVGDLPALLFRPGVLEWDALKTLAWLPAIFIFLGGSVGVLGLGATALLLFKNRAKRGEQPILFFTIFALGLALYYLITGPEVRRHASIWFSLLVPIWFILSLPNRMTLGRDEKHVGAIFWGLALLLHGYFIYSYMGKNSVLDPLVPWKDYFSLNQILKEKFPGLAVIVATEPIGNENLLPPAMEVTESFAYGGHVLVHSKMNAEQIKIVSRFKWAEDVLPYGSRLGYGALVWGPIEEKLWGKKVKERYVDFTMPLARVGSVALYPLKDHLLEKFQMENGALTGSARAMKAAKLLEEKEWCLEAIDNYFEVLKEEPQRALAWTGIGNCLLQRRTYGSARQAFEKALTFSNTDLALQKKLAYALAKEGKRERAKEIYERLVGKLPQDADLCYDLAKLYRDSDTSRARFWIEQAARLSPKDSMISALQQELISSLK